MGRKKTPGLYLRGEHWHIDKVVRGVRICESTGTGDLREAEEIIARRIDETRQASIFGIRPERSFRKAATKFIMENQALASISDYVSHLKQLDPYIGDMPLTKIHAGTLASFIKARKKAGKKSKTINLALGSVRHILNLAADEWIDEQGLTWLERAPKIKLLPTDDQRHAHPLSWDEQSYLFRHLPAYLADMSLFKVNSGTREQEVCQLRWDWEIPVPELDTSVFLIPQHMVKNREERLIVLNGVAKQVIEAQRGKHPQFVFTFNGRPLSCMNNTKWQRGRINAAITMAIDTELFEFIDDELTGNGDSLSWIIKGIRVGHSKPASLTYTIDDYNDERLEKGLEPIRGNRRNESTTKQVMQYKALKRFIALYCPEVLPLANTRVHDLKHTFGRRLRAAGVSFEDRQDLLGHKSGRITTHYSAAELSNLIEAANRVCETDSRKSPALVVLQRKSG